MADKESTREATDQALFQVRRSIFAVTGNIRALERADGEGVQEGQAAFADLLPGMVQIGERLAEAAEQLESALMDERNGGVQ